MKRTGGQLNVAGILFQMLVSLAEGLDATVSAIGGTDATTVTFRPEPFDGGDVQVGGRRRRVVQIKRRDAKRRWTVGAIVRDVLPDLAKAAVPGGDDLFRFVTDNDQGCEDFRRFLAWYRARSGPDAEEVVATGRYRFGRGAPVTADVLLLGVAECLGMRVDDRRLHALLSSLEIVRQSEDDLSTRIDETLRILVERVEDVAHKRTQLLGELVSLGASGAEVSASGLLRDAQLDPRRLVHAGMLARTLRERLPGTLAPFGYDPDDDVRDPLPFPTRSLTVLRGESGLGKTWSLCAMARGLADAGRPVILLRASADVDRLRERVAAGVWNPAYTERAPLPSVVERLRPALADERGVWLTVFLDDLNDPALARNIVEDGWDRLGIDLVVTSQPATADWLRASTAAPEVVEVSEFTRPQLSALLRRHDIDPAAVLDDVFTLLFKPIMARLFCRLPHGLVRRGETEYELMRDFWEHAARDRPARPRHAFDLDRLELLVGDMLAGPPVYPWPPASSARTLDFDAIERLAERGIVAIDGRRRLAMAHDRLLNWAMARHLADRARDHELTSAQLRDLVIRVQDLATLGGVRIGNRFAHLPMDLLWLLLEPGHWGAERVADFLLALLRDPRFVVTERSFLGRTLPTLGARAVPLLRAMVAQRLDGDREARWAAWMAEGMRACADGAWSEVRDAAVAMFASGNAVQSEAALEVLAKVDAPDLLDRLHELNLRRVRELEGSRVERRSSLLRAQQRAFDAFARAAAGGPAWLDARIAEAADGSEAEQLLWALLRQGRTVALPIWRARRHHVFETIREGARVLPYAVRLLADQKDLRSLRLPPPAGADMLYGAAAFDAISRLDPLEALRILRDEGCGDDALDLRGTEAWWLPGLHFRTRARVGEALLQRARGAAGADAVDRLATVYQGHPELMEAATVDFLLDALDGLLASDDAPRDRLPKSARLLGTLSSARTAATLDRIAARRGTRLETALAAAALGRPPSNSQSIDREGEAIARLLAIMAGAGFDRLVLSQLASAGRATRRYGLGHAPWTTCGEVGEALDAVSVDEGARADGEAYLLMEALAAHGRDRALALLVAETDCLYVDAADIRKARSGDRAALADDIRAAVASYRTGERAHAVDLSYLLSSEQCLTLTAPLVLKAAPGDDLSRRLLMLHLHHDHYEPALLPKIAPFLEEAGPEAPIVALHLASNGDAAARGASLRWLSHHGLGDVRGQGFRIASALLEHEDSREGAIAFLRLLHARWDGFGRPDAEMLHALARNGDAAARERLLDLAYGGGKDIDAVAGAVRIVSREDPTTGYHAALRLFERAARQDTADLLIEADPASGLTKLVSAYVGAPTDERMAIARAVRWRAPRERLMPALAGMALAADETLREIAADIGGWLPHGEDLPWLRGLVADKARAVERAALAAANRRAAGAAGAELLALIPSLPRPAQWAYLRALIELVDPYLLSRDGDPLDIRPVLDELPQQFGFEARRLLERRRQHVDRKARREDRS